MYLTLKRLVWTLGTTACVAVLGLAVFAASITRTAPAAMPTADGIVVLTGGEQRVREGMRLLAGGHARRLLISGVNRHTSRDEIRRMSGLDALLFSCCVDIGYEALDTIGNADETRVWARTWGFERLIVVTANYHMPRSLVELSRAMPRTTLVAHPVVTRGFHADGWWRYARSARLLVSEYLKLLPSIARYAFGKVTGETLSGVAAATRERTPASFVAKQ